MDLFSEGLGQQEMELVNWVPIPAVIANVHFAIMRPRKAWTHFSLLSTFDVLS